MQDLQIFNFEELPVRTLTVNEEPFFVGKDVAEILGYSNTRDALYRHVDGEDKDVVKLDTLGGKQSQTIINESGLYSLIFSSKLESAKRFKRWVTSEVLPAIRKHGLYATDNVIKNTLNNPDYIINVLTEYKKEKEHNLVLEQQVKENKPKVLFADSVAGSDNSILVGELAKLLKQNGVDVGQNRLFKWLRNNGYLIKKSGESYNLPTQKSMDLEILDIKKRVINNPDGSSKITRTPKVTGKGQQYFINKFLTEPQTN
ncbi:phage antirepressor [Staphylococcus epidermidis]|uniref:Putative antirepressor n=2 Tax=root TaxID=1 RepID=A0A2H4JCR9_9CAUD|nr:phage antirepressor [Staphylococcus epidermidis]ASN70118.1 putative antirepressor [uncultured Caudovirales phage]EPZ40742.1 phage antirepressor protein KilAC domain protein [Staphylococcus epidermidis E13A]MDH9959193.1 phage antirepressor [Staphylococcus epidermidis]MDU1373392.1 phage antirepressor [Staphylococcus epidermidis]UTF79209.1 phage antirepressor [Staphylococcus epidermidis]